jgi:hypothetical protein
MGVRLAQLVLNLRRNLPPDPSRSTRLERMLRRGRISSWYTGV